MIYDPISTQMLIGKHSGETIEQISLKDSNYLKWAYDNLDNEHLKKEIENCIEL